MRDQEFWKRQKIMAIPPPNLECRCTRLETPRLMDVTRLAGGCRHPTDHIITVHRLRRARANDDGLPIRREESFSEQACAT